jgi:tetratricopeptide (TPR) repeat protein
MERCYQLLAYCYREINLFEESHKNLELAIEINPYNYENFYHLGFSFIWKKNYQEAIECFKKCYELNNKYLPALYQLNNLLKYKVDSAEHNFLIGLNEKDLDTNNLSWKYLTLADIYYNDNDINSFFKNLHKANHLKNKLIAYKHYDRECIKKNYKKLPNLNFESYPSIPIFIVGMPRSGSSLIEQVLSQSDEIYAAGEIPILHENFKNQVFIENKTLSTDNLLSIRNIYINFISSHQKKKYFIDKLPLNFLWIGYIKSIFPEAIFIHTHRNNLDIFMSLYRTFFADGVLEFSYSQDNIVEFYNLYKNIIQFWSEENIDIIDIKYENVIDSPTLEFTKLFESLNLPFNKSYLDLENINRPVKTASFLQINKRLQKFNYPDWSLFKHEIPIFFED